MKYGKTKNKHGRTGVRRPRAGGMRQGQPVTVPTLDRTRPEYKAGYESGWRDGYATANQEQEEFLETLLTKRNAKDIKGLIDRHLSPIDRMQRGS